MKVLMVWGIKIFSFLPLSLAQWFACGIGFLLYWVPNSIRRVTSINIKKVFVTKSVGQQNQLIRQSIIHTIVTAAEMPRIFMAKPASIFKYIHQTVGLEQAEADHQKNKPMLFIGPHFGCWEAAGLALSNQFLIHTLYTAPDSPVLDEMVKLARARSGAVMSPANTKGVIAMMRALKNNGCVAILADQVPTPDNGIYAPFFNIPTFTMTLIAGMYNKYEPAVYITYAVRAGFGKGYVMHYKDITPYVDQCRNMNFLDDNQKFIYAVNKSFEEIIISAPEQYEWSYKRFKSQPRCMLDPYRKELD